MLYHIYILIYIGGLSSKRWGQEGLPHAARYFARRFGWRHGGQGHRRERFFGQIPLISGDLELGSSGHQQVQRRGPSWFENTQTHRVASDLLGRRLGWSALGAPYAIYVFSSRQFWGCFNKLDTLVSFWLAVAKNTQKEPPVGEGGFLFGIFPLRQGSFRRS